MQHKAERKVMEDNKAIDVEYTPVKESTNEELAAQANALYESMNKIGYMGLQMASEAGAKLKVVKNRLEHGQWEDWCTKNLTFGLRKANRMMKLSEKTIDENSFFSNPSTLTDIGISKVWMLLSAPEEAAEEVAANPNAPDMTTKEFRAELDRVKTENERLETENLEIAHLKAELDKLKSKPDKSEKLNEEIQNMKDELKKAKQDLMDKDDSDKEKWMEAGRSEAEKNADDSSKEMLESLKESKLEILRLQKVIDASGNEELVTLKIKAAQLQEDFKACIDSLEQIKSVDPETGAKMDKFIKAILDSMSKAIRKDE